MILMSEREIKARAFDEISEIVDDIYDYLTDDKGGLIAMLTLAEVSGVIKSAKKMVPYAVTTTCAVSDETDYINQTDNS